MPFLIISSFLLINFIHYSLMLLLLLSFLRKNLNLLLRNHLLLYGNLLVNYFLWVFHQITNQHSLFLLKNPINSISYISILLFFTIIFSYFQNFLIQIFFVSSLTPLYLTNHLSHFTIFLLKHLYQIISYLNHQFLSLNYLIYYLMLIFHFLIILIPLIGLFFLIDLLLNPLLIYYNLLKYYYNHLPSILISLIIIYSSLIRYLILFELFYHPHHLLSLPILSLNLQFLSLNL